MRTSRGSRPPSGAYLASPSADPRALRHAGDGNVDTWTGPGRDDPDVFAEYVAFPETHDDVKRILTSWWLQPSSWAGD